MLLLSRSVLTLAMVKPCWPLSANNTFKSHLIRSRGAGLNLNATFHIFADHPKIFQTVKVKESVAAA